MYVCMVVYDGVCRIICPSHFFASHFSRSTFRTRSLFFGPVSMRPSGGHFFAVVPVFRPGQSVRLATFSRSSLFFGPVSPQLQRPAGGHFFAVIPFFPLFSRLRRAIFRVPLFACHSSHATVFQTHPSADSATSIIRCHAKTFIYTTTWRFEEGRIGRLCTKISASISEKFKVDYQTCRVQKFIQVDLRDDKLYYTVINGCCRESRQAWRNIINRQQMRRIILIRDLFSMLAFATEILLLVYTQLLSLFLDLIDACACAAGAVGGWYAGMVPVCIRVVGISLGVDAFACVLQVWSFGTMLPGKCGSRFTILSHPNNAIASCASFYETSVCWRLSIPSSCSPPLACAIT